MVEEVYYINAVVICYLPVFKKGGEPWGLKQEKCGENCCRDAVFATANASTFSVTRRATEYCHHVEALLVNAVGDYWKLICSGTTLVDGDMVA